MSAIDAFSGSSNPTNSTDAFAALTSGEFLQIIFTELQNQDPLEPNDTSAMLDQLATLRTIESDTQMVDSLQRMVNQSEMAASSQLIGSLVSGITLDNRRVSDLVISVSMTQDGPVLNMFDGSRMFFSNVDEIVGPIDDLIDDDADDDDIIDDDTDDDTDADTNGDSNTVNRHIDTVNPGDVQVDNLPDADIDPIQKTVSSNV